jgi:hypothetical protein
MGALLLGGLVTGCSYLARVVIPEIQDCPVIGYRKCGLEGEFAIVPGSAKGVIPRRLLRPPFPNGNTSDFSAHALSIGETRAALSYRRPMGRSGAPP